MPYVPMDKVSDAFLKEGKNLTPYTDGGAGFNPQASWHIKWHPAKGLPGVADRFHVTREGGEKFAVYYVITATGKLEYAEPCPDGPPCTHERYAKYAKADMQTADALATGFLSKIRDLVGPDGELFAREVKERKEKADTSFNAMNDLFKVVMDLNDRLRRYQQAGIAAVKGLKPLPKRDCPLEAIKERKADLDAVARALEAKKEAEVATRANLLPNPLPLPLPTAAPPRAGMVWVTPAAGAPTVQQPVVAVQAADDVTDGRVQQQSAKKFKQDLGGNNNNV